MPATPYVELPLAERTRSWDATKAELSVRRWASSDGSGDKDTIDWPKYRKGFFWYDADNAENFAGYKLGFAEVIDGRLQAVPRGIFAVAAVLRGSRGGVDIPRSDVAAVKAHVARYYERLEMAPPWETEAGAEPPNVKSFRGGEVKDLDAGIVTAVFSTFGVVDLDGDIVEPGAIKPGPVRVSAYGHGSWGRDGAALLPVGRGTINTDNEKAWAEMQFFMDTTHGRDTFNTIKGMGELQEWSYSLRNIKAVYEEINGRTVRRIKSVDVHEVSPVLMGASIGTGTVSVKEGLPFQEHVAAVLADVMQLNERTQQIVALRSLKGKAVSEGALEQLDLLRGQLRALEELLVAEPKEAVAEQLQHEYLRFVQRLQLGNQGR